MVCGSHECGGVIETRKISEKFKFFSQNLTWYVKYGPKHNIYVLVFCFSLCYHGRNFIKEGYPWQRKILHKNCWKITTVDVDMPLRIISYDGAGYRAQLSGETSPEQERYPVITLVLFFGKGRWTGPKNLLGRVKVPKGMEALVSDYRINVFDIGQLSEDKIRIFTSDFQVVAEYVTQMEQKREYTPSGKSLRHIDGVMDLLEALTKVSKYKEAVSVMKQIKEQEGEVSMRSAWGEAIVRGEERGRQQGKEEGWMEACETMAKAMFNEPNYSKEMIIRITKLPQSRVEELEKEVKGS